MSELGSLRLAYGQALVELGEKDPNIVVLDADLSASTHTYMFREKFPERFFNMGIAEADMICTAAGLASCGKTVFASTFAVFATGRAWDQIRLSISYQKLPVKIVATHGGLGVGPDGYSHQAIEDIGLMRLLPGMKVVAPCDAVQTKAVIHAVAKEPGPFYVRVLKQLLPPIYKEGYEFKLGSSNLLTDGKDVTIGTYGMMVAEALKVQKSLEAMNISARVIDFASIKPVDKSAIMKACDETGAFVTCEDHTVIGGLGDAVAEIILAYKPIPHLRIGMQDRFSESGSASDLYEKYGLTAKHITQKIKDFLEK
ncbi:MAG: transketolase family protein [bacterium]|nr:transketolase family protein [bacterium]